MHVIISTITYTSMLQAVCIVRVAGYLKVE